MSELNKPRSGEIKILFKQYSIPELVISGNQMRNRGGTIALSVMLFSTHNLIKECLPRMCCVQMCTDFYSDQPSSLGRGVSPPLSALGVRLSPADRYTATNCS